MGFTPEIKMDWIGLDTVAYIDGRVGPGIHKRGKSKRGILASL